MGIGIDRGSYVGKGWGRFGWWEGLVWGHVGWWAEMLGWVGVKYQTIRLGGSHSHCRSGIAAVLIVDDHGL
jgi:hypothetical protein